MTLSGNDAFAATTALIVALAFLLGWGLFERFRYKTFNAVTVLGLISVSLTGGIGLAQLDPQWLASREAAIPGLLGIAVPVSTRTRYPVIAIPSMLMMLAIFYYLWRTIHGMTGLALEDALASNHRKSQYHNI